jgi:hypothetical protein
MATQKERRAAPRKPASKPPVKDVSPAKDAPRSAPRAAQTKPLSNEDLYNLIAESAYFKAKARGFAPGGEIQDWIEAEAEVRMRVGEHRRAQ